MDKPFFVMLNWQNGRGAMPLVEDNDDVAFYATLEEAREAAENHDACRAFGYEIFERGTGE